MALFDWFKAIFSKAVKLFKELLKEAIPLIAQVIIGQLSQIATQIIEEMNSTDWDNKQKREEAFTRIKAYATRNGISARDSLINLVIELAVLKFKRDW